MPVFAPALAPAGASSSTLPDAPPCIWVVPFAPPRICVSDEAPCASTGPASRAEIATAIAEVFTSFIQFSKVLLTTNSSIYSKHRSQRTCPSPDQSLSANGAPAMQAARCGDRAGISGSFCESLATADRICDASISSGKFRKNILMHAFDPVAA
jgi:hypothetical protein